MKELPLRET